MMKIIIIIILILLLLITLYSYYCLSNQMINYETTRLQHIMNKEQLVNNKIFKINSLEECNNNNTKYYTAIQEISNIINRLNLPINNFNNNNNSFEENTLIVTNEINTEMIKKELNDNIIQNETTNEIIDIIL